MNLANMETSESLLLQLRDRISALPELDRSAVACIGFDGFVDTIQRAVHSKGQEGYKFFNNIIEFAGHLGTLQGKSGQVELVSKKIKIGGNAPILSNALGLLGVRNVCLGAMGFPEIHPLFKHMDPLSHPISLSPPGKSNALEFSDGKIIFSELSAFDDYDWTHVRRTVELSKLRTLVHDCRLFAFVDWVNLTHATSLWKGFLDDVIRSAGRKDFLFMFDLCDPSKKTPKQVREVLQLITSFSEFGQVTIGLNENEANKIWMALNDFDLNTVNRIAMPPLEVAGEFIYQATNIETLLIHLPDRSIAFTRGSHEMPEVTGKPHVIDITGRLVTQPAVLTGGGDNLNAGYCLGWLSGLEVQYCVLLGIAAAGAYIQYGTSPEPEDLISYIDTWAREAASSSRQENADVGLFL